MGYEILGRSAGHWILLVLLCTTTIACIVGAIISDVKNWREEKRQEAEYKLKLAQTQEVRISEKDIQRIAEAIKSQTIGGNKNETREATEPKPENIDVKHVDESEKLAG